MDQSHGYLLMAPVQPAGITMLVAMDCRQGRECPFPPENLTKLPFEFSI